MGLNVRGVWGGCVFLAWLLGSGPVLSKEFSLTLLYSNTNNGVLQGCSCPRGGNGGLPRRLTVIKQQRGKEKNVLLVDSGDMFPVMPDSGKAMLILNVVKAMKYDFLNLGDQEFYNGVDFIKRCVDQGEWPFYSATLKYIDAENNTIYPLVPPYKIEEIGGRKIGIIGVVCPDAFKFFPSQKKKNLLVTDVGEALHGILGHFKKEQITIVILVSHCGYTQDQELAAQFPDLDVIVGGHSQTLLEKPEKVKSTLIVQAGEGGERLGKLKLTFNDEGKVTSQQGSLFLLSRDVEDDPAVAEMIKDYNTSRMTNQFWHY